jgi:hypothetical protein
MLFQLQALNLFEVTINSRNHRIVKRDRGDRDDEIVGAPVSKRGHR